MEFETRMAEAFARPPQFVEKRHEEPGKQRNDNYWRSFDEALDQCLGDRLEGLKFLEEDQDDLSPEELAEIRNDIKIEYHDSLRQRLGGLWIQRAEMGWEKLSTLELGP